MLEAALQSHQKKGSWGTGQDKKRKPRRLIGGVRVKKGEMLRRKKNNVELSYIRCQESSGDPGPKSEVTQKKGK